MNVLIVDDDSATRLYLTRLLASWQYSCQSAVDGLMAKEMLLNGEYDLLIVDWLMPRVNGLELLRFVREHPDLHYIYSILLTQRSSPEDYREGMQAGADDFLTKPVAESELQMRLTVGRRIIAYQKQLREYNRRLQEALSDVETLGGFIHMCSYCNSVYTPEEKWVDVSEYLRRRTNITISHGICPTCIPKMDPNYRPREAASE